MSNELVKAGPSRVVLPQSFRELWEFANAAAKSGLYAVRSPEAALVILQTGMELGLMPTQSLRGIHVVQGRPVLSADLCVAVVQASPLCEFWHTVESTPERCTIETRRRGAPALVSKTWTAEDAKRAELSGKGIWKQYPAQMLRHRCAADLAREVYPDLLLGIYVPAEFEDPREMRPEPVAVVEATPPALPSPPVRPSSEAAAAQVVVAAAAPATQASEETERKEPEVLASFRENLAHAMSADGVVTLWRRYAKHLAAACVRDEGRKLAIQAVVHHRGCSESDAEAWLTEQLQPPPQGPRGVRQQPQTTTEATGSGEHAVGSVADATQAKAKRGAWTWDGTVAGWEAHLATKEPEVTVKNSHRAHALEFGDLLEPCEQATARRLEAFGHSEGNALAIARNLTKQARDKATAVASVTTAARGRKAG